MARKRKSGLAEDFMDLVALMPWWAGVLLAVVSYLFFHSLAGRQVAPSGNPADMGSMVSKGLVFGFANLLQFAVPALCLFGAVGSVIRRRRRRELLGRAATGHTASVVDGMSWQQFEILVGEALRQKGYRVTETGGGGADGGVDLVLTKNGEKFLVQCKQWRAFKVGVSVVRELYGVMAAKGAPGGFVVTSGSFTSEAKAFAHGRNITLVDGQELAKWIRASTASTPRTEPVMSKPVTVPSALPSCPVCSKSMVKRVAGRGANAGNAFWGCSEFPRCKGTRPA